MFFWAQCAIVERARACSLPLYGSLLMTRDCGITFLEALARYFVRRLGHLCAYSPTGSKNKQTKSNRAVIMANSSGLGYVGLDTSYSVNDVCAFLSLCSCTRGRTLSAGLPRDKNTKAKNNNKKAVSITLSLGFGAKLFLISVSCTSASLCSYVLTHDAGMHVGDAPRDVEKQLRHTTPTNLA